VPLRQTTRCCSAIALVLLCACASAARQAPSVQLSLLPLRAIWSLPLNNALSAPPAFNGTRAYFPIAENRLAAYDLADGHQLWLVSATVRLEPAASDDLVFIADEESITALSAEDGSVKWRATHGDPLAAPLVWDNGWLIAAETSGALSAYRAADGHLVWRRDVGWQLHARPALVADRVYVPAGDGRIIALQLETGEPIWQHRLGGPPNDILALDDRIYVGANDNFLYCLDALDGSTRWRWRTGNDVIGRPAIDDTRVYFVSLDNLLRALDQRSGAQIWKRALPVRPSSGPIVANDAVIVMGIDPAARAFRASDGAPGADIPVKGVAVAQLHIVAVRETPLPLAVFMTADIENHVTVTALTRSIDPPVTQIAPLPNPTPIPKLSTEAPQ
jgi:outer membrane protein assembly factor BamB